MGGVKGFEEFAVDFSLCVWQDVSAFHSDVKIKTGDQVVIISGGSKGQQGVVKRVLSDDNKVIVEGVNMVTKHVKSTKNKPSGRIQVEAALDASNVKVMDGKDSSRVGYQTGKNGKKERIAKKSGNIITTPFVKN